MTNKKCQSSPLAGSFKDCCSPLAMSCALIHRVKDDIGDEEGKMEQKTIRSMLGHLEKAEDKPTKELVNYRNCI